MGSLPPSLRKTCLLAALALAPALLAGCQTLGTGAQTEAAAPAAPDAGPVLSLARSTHAWGDLSGAAGLYRRAHEINPNAVEPLLGLSRVLRDASAPDEAVLAY